MLDRIKSIIYFFIKRPLYVFKRHIWLDILEGNFSKPWHFFRSALKHKLLGYPYLVMIETCNFCNLKCPTCTTPHRKMKRERKMMSFEEYRRIIDNIKDSVHIVLLYFSNEPLLHPQLPEMIEYAHKNNLYTMISTNAMLLDKRMSQKLYEAKLDEILLCLDGLKKESFEAFREGAVFEVVLENIKNFCRMKQSLEAIKPYIKLQFILNKLNQNEVGDVEKFAQEFKIDRLHIKPFALSEYAYTKDEIKELMGKFFPTKKEYQGKIVYENEDNVLKLKKRTKVCSLPDSDIVILADGRVVICCYDFQGEYSYGNVLNNKLKDIWNSPESRFKREMARNRKYPLCQICAT